MKKVGALVFGVLICLAFSSAAFAGVVFDLAGGDISSSMPVLVPVSVVDDLDDVGFELEVGESSTFLFGHMNSLGAEEAYITAEFYFDLPDVDAAVSGTVTGHWQFLNYTWQLVWEPTYVSFGAGDTGLFKITLSDYYNQTWNMAYCEELYATVTLEAAPVPIPAAVWLLGSGLVGLAGLRRKLKI